MEVPRDVLSCSLGQPLASPRLVDGGGLSSESERSQIMPVNKNMAGTDEFELNLEVFITEALRKSSEAWESYCNSYPMKTDDDGVMVAGETAAASTERVLSPSFSHFLKQYGVQNVIMISSPPISQWTGKPCASIAMVVRGGVGHGSRWGNEDMMLTMSRSQLDRKEWLDALAHFGGGVFLTSGYRDDLQSSTSLMTPAEASAFFTALCNSSTPPHTLSIVGDSILDLSNTDHEQPHHNLTVGQIMMHALRQNPKIRNFALVTASLPLRLDDIGSMEGISLDRLFLHGVSITPEFLLALSSLTYSSSVTHSLSLMMASWSPITVSWSSISAQFDEFDNADWQFIFSQFLQWQLKCLSLYYDTIHPSELIGFMDSLQKCTDTSLQSLSLGNLFIEYLYKENIDAQLVGMIVDALHQSSLPHLYISQIRDLEFYSERDPIISSPAIQAQLLRNQRKRANTGFVLLEAQQKVAAAAVRMFICGDPYAGKTTLMSTLVSLVCASSKSLAHKIKGFFLPFLCGDQYRERTQGIEIHRITRGGIQLSLWDLAGQREFHAFHDLMFPDSSGNSGSPTIFMFVWSPVDSGDAQKRKIRNEEDFNNSFLYWLKFIASKTRQSAILRKLIVVITHNDQVKLLDAMFTKSSIEAVAANFRLMIEVVEVLTLDARDPSEVKPLVSHIFETAKTVLEGIKIYAVCNAVSKYLLSPQQAKQSQVNGKPIISWEEFSALCESKFQVTDPKIQKAIAYSLNDSGDIIYLGNLPFLVLDPNWFCREVMGSLLHLSEKGFLPIPHGYAKQSYLQRVLENSTHSKVEGSILVSIMEAMHLCHRVSDDNIFIPALLCKSTTDNITARQWKMPVEGNKYTYVGRRLECDRKDVTFLTPGLFPMIQVVFGNAFEGEDADLGMVEDCMHICLLEMEIIVECGHGKQGHVIDVMVRASVEKLRNGGGTVAFVEEEIVKTLIRVCAQPEGNQGVTLVESVIRPDCLHGPAPLKVRDDQCVLVLDLQQKLRRDLEAGFKLGQLQYLWKSSPGVQPTKHSFMELLGFEGHMQVLVSYHDSLQNASVSLLSHVPSTERDQLPRPYLAGGSTEMEGNNDDVVSTSTAPIISQKGDEICEEVKESNSKTSTSGSRRFLDSYLQLEETKDGSTDEKQGQIVDKTGKDMVRAIFREVRSMNYRLKAMDARQQEMERKTNHIMHSIEKMRSDLLPGIRAMVEKCFAFAVESEAGRTPRFVFITEMDVVGGAPKRRMVMTSLFKGLTKMHIELFCEHRRGPHRVDSQDGVYVTIVDDEDAFVVKALPYVKGFLKMLTLVTKVGAHVLAGAESMVPDFTKIIGLVLDTPNGLDSLSRLLTGTPVSAASLEGWQDWLLSVLEKQGKGATAINIYAKFKLRRHRFQDTGKVAWLCDEHYPH